MNTYIKTGVFSLALLVATTFSGQVSAQETEALTSVLPDNAVLVSNANMYDVRVVSQEKNKVLIGFDISNDGGTVYGDVVESGLRYGIKVIEGKTTNEQGITIYGPTVDERAFDEVLTLRAGETIHKEILYIAPNSFKGEYYIQVYGVKEGGMPYALAFIEEPVMFEGSADTFSVKMTDCRMVVEGEMVDYDTKAGVDIDTTEKLSFKCTLEAGGGLGTYTPQLSIFRRSVFGDKTRTLNLDRRTVESETTTDVLFSIPLPTEPQAYDAKLVLTTGEGEEIQIISNTVVGHFVVRGQSGTIQDIQIDKDFYRAGDTAQVAVTISGEAGKFLNSRAYDTELPETDTVDEYYYTATMASGDTLCADSGEKKRFEANEYGSMVLPLSVTEDCVNPTTKFVLTNKEGKQLDEKTVFAVSENPTVGGETSDEIVRGGGMSGAVMLALLLVLLLAGYTLYKRRKGSRPDDLTPPPPSNIVGVLAFALVSTLSFSALTANAATYLIPASSAGAPQSTALVLNNSSAYYPLSATSVTISYSGTLLSSGSGVWGLALFGGNVAGSASYGSPVVNTGGILNNAVSTTFSSGISFTRPMTTKNPGTANYIPLTGVNYSIISGDALTCNARCDKNLSWDNQTSGYTAGCECYDINYLGATPTNISHAYGIARTVDFTISSTPVVGCAGGATTEVSVNNVVGANTFEIDCGAGFISGQTTTCNLISSGSHTISARARFGSEPWVTKTATVVVPECTTAVNGMCGPLSGRLGDWDVLSTTYDKCEQGAYRLTSTDKDGRLGFYEWSCEGVNSGRSASCWLEQRVATEPLLKLTHLPDSVEVDDTLYLSWQTQNVSRCTATGGSSGSGWAGDKPLNGSQEITFTSAGWPHFYLQCWNSEGVATQIEDAYIHVKSNSDATTNGISSLDAIQSTINYGESSTIVWTTVGDVARCSAYGGEWPTWRDVPINGSVEMTPRKTTNYTLRCYSAADVAWRDRTAVVTVENTPTGVSGNIATCPYVPTEDSVIVNFNSGLSRDSDISIRTLHSEQTSFYQSVPTIPAGFYDVETVSYDGYWGRGSTPGQPSERWFAQFSPYSVPNNWFYGETDLTTDIADGVEENHRTDSFPGVELKQDIKSVVVRHAIGTEGQSVVPVCMKISPAGKAPMLTLKADPVEINSGDESTLTWTPTNADKCIASGGAVDGWTGEMSAVDGTYTHKVRPSVNTTYYMECWDSTDQSTGVRSALVEVTGGTAPNLTFTASPNNIVAGEPSNLHWTPTNVDSCTASGGEADSWPGDRDAAGGDFEVRPSVTTTYTLECEDASGIKTGPKTATVTVATPAVLEVDIITVPSPATFGEDVKWTAYPTGGSGTKTYRWYGDIPNESTGEQNWIQKPVDKMGRFRVHVEVTDSSGTATDYVDVLVTNNLKPQ